MTGPRTFAKPLLAIADMAGGDWPALARTALVLLRDKGDTDEEEPKIQLLAAAREIRQTWKRDHISSKDFLDELVNREDEPWGVWWKKDIDAGNTKGPGARLAKLLKPFGIIPKTIREDGATLKGYQWSAFKEPSTAHLPPLSPVYRANYRHNTSQPHEHKLRGRFEDVTHCLCYVPKMAGNPHQ